MIGLQKFLFLACSSDGSVNPLYSIIVNTERLSSLEVFMVMSLYAWRDGQTGVHHPALDSKSSAFAGVPVRLRPAAPNLHSRPLGVLGVRSPPQLTWSSALYGVI